MKYTITRCAILVAFSVLTTIFLSSCSAMLGQGVVSKKQSEFDQSETITVSPAMMKPLKNSSWSVNLNLGAMWNSSSPSKVGLVIEHKGSQYTSAFANIRSIEIKVDGKIYSYKTTALTSHDSGSYNTVSRSFHTSSQNSVIVPLSLVQRMVSANRCLVRIRTSKGTVESDFTQEKYAGMHMAKLHFKKFLAQVQATR